MTSRAPLATLLVSVLGLAACSASPSNQAVDTADAAQGDSSHGDAGAAIGQPVLGNGPGVGGVLHDPDGMVLPFATIMACRTTVCLYGATDQHGRFFFDIDPPATLALKTLERISERASHAALLYPLKLEDELPLYLPDLRVPRLPKGVDVSLNDTEAQYWAVGDGLELGLAPSELTLPVGEELQALSGTRVDPDDWPPLWNVARENIVAMYALHPFGAKSERPISVRVALSRALERPTLARTISAVDGSLSVPTTLKPTEDDAATHEGSGIHELTWLVVSLGDG